MEVKLLSYLVLILSLLAVPVKAVHTTERWSVRMAESTISDGNYQSVNYYVNATAMKGFRHLWQATGNEKYLQYIKAAVDGDLEFYDNIVNYGYCDIDPVNAGSLFLLMYSQTGEAKYKAGADSILKFLKSFPRTTDGGFYHKEMPRMQVDDLYMATPFLAEYGGIFNKTEEYDDAVKQAELMELHTRDSQTGLYYHVWYEEAFRGYPAGCTPCFWGRGVGWVAMSLVDILDFLPEAYSGRQTVIEIFQRLAEALANVQDDTTGLWWQVLDQPGREGNFQESSGSCMFVYALAKGVRLGYIDESYWDVAVKGYQGIIDNFIEENSDGTIKITHVCPGQSPGQDYQSYVRNPYENNHAVGPFILASVELEVSTSAIGTMKRLDTIPKIFTLVNYPNPFNPTTQIMFSIPDEGSVKLMLYNVRGEKVKQLINDVRQAGDYTVIFSGSNLSSGIYFLKLQVGDVVKTRRMMLLK